MKRWSSLRRTAAPIPVAVIAVPFEVALLQLRSGPHCFGAGGDRLDNVVVARAPAEVAIKLMPNGFVVEVATRAIDHVDGGQEQPGRTEAALQGMLLSKGLLYRMRLRAVGGAF